MKKKLRLNELRVESFITEANADKLKGGTGILETNPDIGSCAPMTNLTRCNCYYPTVGDIHCDLVITGPLVGC